MSLKTFLDPAARHRRWIVLVLLLAAGLVVYRPALRARFILDDYLHAAMVDGTYPVHRGPLDLYDFVNDADRKVMFERGMLPWWSHPRLKIRFFRPLPSALRWADHKIFGRAPLPLHLHSLAWWIAAVLAARMLFRRLIPPRPALIATFVFALAPCHALPIAWLANREALISLTFGLLALVAYLRWREDAGVGHAALATLLFALSMSGGEYALCAGGYVLAHVLLSRGEALWRRFVGLMPFAVPAAGYLLVRQRLGYGTQGSGFYADPLREPFAFLALLPRRVVTLLAETWLTLDGDSLRTSTPWWALALLLALGLFVFAEPLRRAYAATEEPSRDAAHWLLLGSCFALLPIAAVVPSPRLLGAAVVGLAPSVGLLLDYAWFGGAPRERHGYAELTQVAAVALGFAHFVHGPGTAWLIGRQYQLSSADFEGWAADLRSRLGSDLTSADVVVLRGWDSAFFMPFALDPRGTPPAHWRALSHTGHALALRRGPRTLDIVVPRGSGVFPLDQHHLFRSPGTHIAAGDVFKAPGMRVTILDVSPAGPRAVRYELDRDLESAATAWVTETSLGFPEAKLPKPGFGAPFEP